MKHKAEVLFSYGHCKAIQMIWNFLTPLLFGRCLKWSKSNSYLVLWILLWFNSGQSSFAQIQMIVQVERGFWTSRTTSKLDQVVQGLVPLNFEYVLRWRFRDHSEQPMPGFGHFHAERSRYCQLFCKCSKQKGVAFPFPK